MASPEFYGDPVEFYSSSLASSSWVTNIFHIWADLWVKVNKALPACYDKYKDKTIKRATTLSWIFGSYNQLIRLKEDGVLTAEIYEQIYAQWETLSDISREELGIFWRLTERKSLPVIWKKGQRESNEKTALITLHYGDLMYSANLISLMNEIEPDEVYNLATQSHVTVSFEVPEYTADTTGMGVIRILEAIRQSGLKTRYYQASTSELFGGIPETAPQNETTPFYPKSPYGAAKLYPKPKDKHAFDLALKLAGEVDADIAGISGEADRDADEF